MMCMWSMVGSSSTMRTLHYVRAAMQQHNGTQKQRLSYGVLFLGRCCTGTIQHQLSNTTSCPCADVLPFDEQKAAGEGKLVVPSVSLAGAQQPHCVSTPILMGGVTRHHSAQQPEEYLANLNEGSAACSSLSASHYSVARPRQELNYTTKVPMPVQFWGRSDVDTMITHLHTTEVYNFQALLHPS